MQLILQTCPGFQTIRAGAATRRLVRRPVHSAAFPAMRLCHRLTAALRRLPPICTRHLRWGAQALSVAIAALAVERPRPVGRPAPARETFLTLWGRCGWRHSSTEWTYPGIAEITAVEMDRGRKTRASGGRCTMIHSTLRDPTVAATSTIGMTIPSGGSKAPLSLLCYLGRFSIILIYIYTPVILLYHNVLKCVNRFNIPAVGVFLL